MITLERYAYTPTATLGRLRMPGRPELYTIERAWANNLPFESAIPEGTYLTERHDSPKFGPCIRILNIPGRSNILIHSANLASQLSGCIAPGLAASPNEFRVNRSKSAMREILEHWPNDLACIHITQFKPTY